MNDRPAVRPQLLWFLVIAIAVLAFLPSITGGWIYDDHTLIPDNPYVHSFNWAPRWLTHDFWNVSADSVRFGGRMIYWRPAVSASYAVDWTVSGGAPIWFHLTNLAGHAAVATMAFLVLRRWLGGALVPAFVTTLLFAIHPTKTESVAWIAGRTDVICMFALLVATTGIARRLRGQRWGAALEAAGTVLAYLSKEQAIVLPAFVVVETWVAADRPAIDLAFARRALRAAAPQLALAVVYIVTRSVLLPMRDGSPVQLAAIDHVLAVLETFGYFFAFTVAPHDLSIQQGSVYTVHGDLHHSMVHVIVGAGGLIALGAAAFACRRRAPGATLGLAFFLATLLPTSNLVYTGMKTLVSERFLYVPMFGLGLAAGTALAVLQGRVRAATTALGLALAALACVASMRRSADFGDEQRFWTRERAMHPTSAEAHAYFIAKAMHDKRYERALAEVLDLQRAFTDRDMPMDERIDAALNVAMITASLVPDLDTASLREIDQFVAAMLAADQPQATMQVRGVRLEVSPSSTSYKRELSRFVPRLLALRIDLAGRLGDHARAAELVATARGVCATCVAIAKSEAMALARAGRLEDALAALDRVAGRTTDPAYAMMRTHIFEARDHRDASLSATGPAAIREQALMYSTLESWGAAYRVLAPHKDDFAHVREVALGFAELAFRAGAPDVAKQVLALHVPAAEIQPMLDDWAAKMGWRD